MGWDPFWRTDKESIIDLLSSQGIGRHERTHIFSLGAWHKEYRILREGLRVPEFRAYIHPIIISSALKARIYEQEFYSFVLLNGVYKDSHISVIGLFPDPAKIPADYSYIRVTNGTKKVLFDTNKNLYDAVVIEEYEVLDSLHIYEGVEYEKNVLNKIFGSAFDKGPISESLQAPLLSAPKVINGKGGISLGAALDQSSFVIELRKTMQQMLPLELQSLPQISKPRVIDTPWLPITAHAPVNPLPSTHSIKFFSPHSFGILTQEEALRITSEGEYSYAAAAFAGGSKQELYRDIADNFFRSDISSIDLGQGYTDEMTFYRLRRDINEDVHISVARAHLINPAISITSTEHEAIFKMLQADMDAHYTGLEYNEQRQSFLKIQAKQALHNTFRIAQSLARAKGNTAVTMDDLKRARVIINSHLERFRDYGGGAAKQYLKIIKRSDKWIEVCSVLQNGRATTKEIWEEIKQYKSFNNIEELQVYLDGREKSGNIMLIRGSYLLTR